MLKNHVHSQIASS